MQAKKPFVFLRLLFYILILSFVLSQLFFFGILMMIPMDLMFFAEDNANVWGFLVPFFVGSLTLYLLHKNKTAKNTKFAEKSRKFALGIGLLLSIVFSGILLLVFVNFTKLKLHKIESGTLDYSGRLVYEIPWGNLEYTSWLIGIHGYSRN
ncbi:MAG: hypothetical protein ACTSRE_15820 [Promethearchaeota archaeon]